MIKKIAAIALMIVSLPVLAGKDDHEIKLKGEVVSIDTATQTFILKDANNLNNTFKVTPATEFETKCESCMIEENIMPISFDALKVGDWVKVEYEGNTEIKVADEVKIFRKS